MSIIILICLLLCLLSMLVNCLNYRRWQLQSITLNIGLTRQALKGQNPLMKNLKLFRGDSSAGNKARTWTSIQTWEPGTTLKRLLMSQSATGVQLLLDPGTRVDPLVRVDKPPALKRASKPDPHSFIPSPVMHQRCVLQVLVRATTPSQGCWGVKVRVDHQLSSWLRLSPTAFSMRVLSSAFFPHTSEIF